jgi:hypothetical protein
VATCDLRIKGTLSGSDSPSKIERQRCVTTKAERLRAKFKTLVAMMPIARTKAAKATAMVVQTIAVTKTLKSKA